MMKFIEKLCQNILKHIEFHVHDWNPHCYNIDLSTRKTKVRVNNIRGTSTCSRLALNSLWEKVPSVQHLMCISSV